MYDTKKRTTNILFPWIVLSMKNLQEQEEEKQRKEEEDVTSSSTVCATPRWCRCVLACRGAAALLLCTSAAQHTSASPICTSQ